MSIADNVICSPGSGGATFRTLSDGTVEWPVSVAAYVVGGSSGAWSLQTVDAAHGLPVAVESLPLPTGAATAANQAAEIADLAAIVAALGGTLTVSVSNFPATQPVSAASLPLPAGAATAAKQPALGTAGSASADVITVQGVASMTPLKVDGSGVTQPVSGTFWQATQPVSIAANVTVVGTGTLAVQAAQSGGWTVTANAGTNLNTSALALETGGNLAAAKADLDTLAACVSASKVTVTISGTPAVSQSGTWNVGTVTTVTTVSTVTSLSQWAGNAIDTNSGSKSGGTLRVVLATDQPALNNKLLVTPDNSSPVAATSGGATPYHLISAASTNGTNVKASAGQIYSIAAFNTNASARYLKLYNKATAPTVGTDTPVQTFLIPGNANGAGLTLSIPVGMAFSSGIGLGITGAMADNDTTAVGAGDVCLSLTYL